MSIDSDKSREGLGGLLSYTFLGKGTLGDSRPPRPYLTPTEELNLVKSQIITAIDEADFDKFTENFKELRKLAQRGHLPPFNFFYATCREIHGREKFVAFFGEYIPDDPTAIFNKHPEVVPFILSMEIKAFQFHAYINKGAAMNRNRPEPEVHLQLAEDAVSGVRLGG